MGRARLPAVALILVAACGADRLDPVAAADPPAPADAAPAAADAPADPRRWIAGDLHMHVSPFDDREGTTLTAAELGARAADAGLEFLILTPHVRPSSWRSRDKRQAWQARWRAMADDAHAAAGVTLIPGAEYTETGYGHFGVSGVDLAALDGGDLLGAATAAGGFVVVNHPFAVPTHIEGFAISERDLSFRPWTERRGAVPRLDGVEVYNLPLDLANLVSRPGGLSGEERAFAAADALARAERRPVAVVGGSDNHRTLIVPTTWVLAPDAAEASILAALKAGATCVGGAEAGGLEARGEDDVAWRRIGEVTRGDRVALRWPGTARLFVDGVDAGEHDGGYLHADAAGAHTYRIEVGASRCGFAYANLD